MVYKDTEDMLRSVMFKHRNCVPMDMDVNMKYVLNESIPTVESYSYERVVNKLTDVINTHSPIHKLDLIGNYIIASLLYDIGGSLFNYIFIVD